MGLYFHCMDACRHTHLFILLTLVTILLSSTQLRCHGKGEDVHVKMQEVNGEMKLRIAAIGSRPPRCAGKCSSCGHCEAVQVPIVPQGMKLGHLTTIASRGDYSSNYKPMNWKCKCGDVLFNP